MHLPAPPPVRLERVLACQLNLEMPATSITRIMIPRNPLVGNTSTVRIPTIATATGIQQVLLGPQAHPSSD